MQNKTIKAVLKKTLDNWIKSIDDKEVRKLLKENTIITGGAIASMLMNEDVKDFDIYFRNRETVVAVSKYYCKKFIQLNPKSKTKPVVIDCLTSEDGVNYLGVNEQLHLEYVLGESEESPFGDDSETTNKVRQIAKSITNNSVSILLENGIIAEEGSDLENKSFDDVHEELPEASTNDDQQKYRPVFMSTNAITLTDKIQIIIRFYGEIEELHKNYDFVHCTNAYDYRDKELHLTMNAVRACMDRELVYQGSRYPLCSVIRTRKFLKRGYNINAGQYLKMMFQISQLDLLDIDVLEDQLVGVDSAYFGQIIDQLRKAEKENVSIDQYYLTELIDKIF